MRYIFLVVTFLLALVGAFSDSVERDTDGKVKTSHRLPVLTWSGWLILGLLVLSLATSIVLAIKDSTNEKDLRNRIAAFENTDRVLQQSIEEKHRANIEKLGEILSTEQITGLKTTKSIQSSATQLHERLGGRLFEVKTFAVSLALDGLGPRLNTLPRNRVLSAEESEAALKSVFCQKQEGRYSLTLRLSPDPLVNYYLSVRSNGRGECDLIQQIELREAGGVGGEPVFSAVTAGSDGVLYMTALVPGSEARSQYQTPHFLSDFRPDDASDAGSAQIDFDYPEILVPKTIGVVVRPMDPLVDLSSEWSALRHTSSQSPREFEFVYKKYLPPTLAKARRHLTSVFSTFMGKEPAKPQ